MCWIMTKQRVPRSWLLIDFCWPGFVAFAALGNWLGRAGLVGGSGVNNSVR